eukprot:2266413-Heterocapsa_arctica.AAC.1
MALKARNSDIEKVDVHRRAREEKEGRDLRRWRWQGVQANMDWEDLKILDEMMRNEIGVKK